MGWRDWTGVGERRWKTAPNEQVQPPKTLWDLLQLLIVPVILKSRADQVRQDTTLNNYIQQMSDLMLNKRLLSPKPHAAVRSVARTITLTTLRRLDGARKGEVVQFLQESRLIEVSGSPLPLAGANLTGADLRGADLTDADLTGADLAGAYLMGADETHGHHGVPWARSEGVT
jgi:hypothetical protein